MSGFLRECEAQECDVALIEQVATETIQYLRSPALARAEMRPNQALEQRWYASLAAGSPDWSVYDSDLYLADLWACWVVYSRGRLIAIQRPRSLPPSGVLGDIGVVGRVVDLGCGTGYTTSAWSELYPKADVVGTNLEGVQMRLARVRGDIFGFRVASDVRQIEAPADIVFASEYFEHFLRPLDHLTEVLDALHPRTLLIANAFGARSIGHFDQYEVGDDLVDGQTTSRRFNNELRRRGYVKVEATLWNSRPSYWRRRD